MILVDGIVAKAFTKKDADTENIAIAKYHEGKWAASIEQAKRLYLFSDHRDRTNLPFKGFL